MVTPAACTDTTEPPLTVGEVNLRVKLPRCAHWVIAICWPFFNLSGAAILVYGIYDDARPGQTITSVWPGIVIMLWGVYITLVAMVYNYMTLYMPHAPAAVREAVFNVGFSRSGFPLGFVAVLVAYFGQAWMLLYALAAVFTLLIAGAVAFWVWLVKTYPSSK